MERERVNMKISIEYKSKPIEVLGNLDVVEYCISDYIVYIDDKRAPKIIEETILYLLETKKEVFVYNLLKEINNLKRSQ